MKVLTLLNEKGGVGKTTLAQHIAAGLAIHGKRVILIDADPQGNAGLNLGISKQPMLFNLLVRDEPWTNVLVQVPRERFASNDTGCKGDLFLLPGDIETRAIPMLVDDPYLVKDRLEELDGVFDVVVVDTPPTPSLLHGMIYMATDTMLYPVIPAALAIDGLMISQRHREAANKARGANGLGDIGVMGILPNMYRPGVNAHDFGLKQLTNRFKSLVWGAMPIRTAFEQASYARKTLFAMLSPDDDTVRLAWRLVERTERVIQ